MDDQGRTRSSRVVPGRKERVPTGCASMDRLLRGGVLCGSITEFVGESTSGKSQICMQLLIALQARKELGGLGGKSLYIHTEGEPPMNRLKQISEAWVEQGLLPSANACFDNMYVERSIRTTEQLYVYLVRAKDLFEKVCKEGSQIKLIVIDSIAYLFRDIDGTSKEEVIERAGMLFRIGQLLKFYADCYNASVVVTNHVVDVVKTGLHQAVHEQNTGGLVSFISSGRLVAPALGLSWSNCVNTRLFVSRGARTIEASRLRKLQVVFAPHLPVGLNCMYSIDEKGLSSVGHAASDQFD